MGTIGPEGIPHILPVCFTWAGDVIWTAIDGKPKSTKQLQRIKDIQANPKVSFTVDRWDEDWSRLAWLQARGTGRVVPKGPESAKVLVALESKYSQYSEVQADGPVLRIDVERWVSWSAEGPLSHQRGVQ